MLNKLFTAVHTAVHCCAAARYVGYVGAGGGDLHLSLCWSL